MGDLDALGVAGAPIVLALVTMLARTLRLDARWRPLLAVLLGVVWSVGLASSNSTLAAPGGMAKALLSGVVAGLAASGLYSSTKALSGR